MAKDHFYDHQHDGVEEDYIDMEISSTTYLCYTLPSPPHSHSIEFEFKMSSSSSTSKNPETDHIPSPADELFYKGNLLPLHLWPRLHMVETLLHSSPAPPDHPNTTPFESCNISPATSCYVSGELNAEEDYFFKEDCQEEDEELVESRSKKSWCKKLKHSSIGLKLKASKAYLKSLFTKSGCSDETTSAVSKPKDCSGRYWKSGGRKSPTPTPTPTPTPFGQQIQRIDGEKTDGEQCGHRRSFSGAIKRRSSSSMNKSSSSSSSSCSSSNSSSFSSVNSNGPICVPQMLKRSSSVSSDKECSVQGAIAYCKKTQQQQQQQVCARRSVSDVEFFLLSESSCRG